jgi:hypothetical protein
MITNYYLTETAKALNGESFVIPAYLAVGTTDVAQILSTDTTIPGETGTRDSVTKSRSGSSITFTGINPASSITVATGIPVESLGLFNPSSAGTLMIGASFSGLIQTTSFDLEVITQLTVSRK